MAKSRWERFRGANQFQLVVPAGCLANGAEIRKLRGKNKYTIQRTVVIHNNDTPPIEARPGTVFVVGDGSGHIQAITEDTEVLVTLSRDELYELLAEAEGGS